MKAEHHSDSGEVFRYSGPIYVKPCGRGINLGDAGNHLESAVEAGEYEATIIIRRRSNDRWAKLPKSILDAIDQEK